jgi:peptidoglycan hydrolase CwlO-like protein
MLSLRFFGVSSSDVLLILTTIVSLEAIYLSIFIQMTVNQHAEELEEVSEDIEEIQEDVDEIQKDVDEIQEDVEDIQEEMVDEGENSTEDKGGI